MLSNNSDIQKMSGGGGPNWKLFPIFLYFYDASPNLVPISSLSKMSKYCFHNIIPFLWKHKSQRILMIFENPFRTTFYYLFGARGWVLSAMIFYWSTLFGIKYLITRPSGQQRGRGKNGREFHQKSIEM